MLLVIIVIGKWASGFTGLMYELKLVWFYANSMQLASA